MRYLKRRDIFHEEGSIILIALVLLILVTLMGVSITQITSIEMRVAANERDYKRAFYLAEAAAMEALQRLENANPEDLKTSTTTLPWLHGGDTNLEDREVIKDSEISVKSSFDQDTCFAATAKGVTGGSSLSMTTTSRLYSFDAYGYAEKRGQAHIVGGYKRRF